MYPCNLCFDNENRAKTIMETTHVVVTGSDCRPTTTTVSVLSCRTIHVGSLPSIAYGKNMLPQVRHNNRIEASDDLNYSIEMTLRDFQQFLEDCQCWYSSTGSSTRQQRESISRNRTKMMSFDPCNALGAEVSLGDFLMHNHNNIDIKVHDAILSEEIQITDNRRSAVLIITEQQQQQQYDFDASLEVQPIHTFDDLIPPNLMNASFDLNHHTTGSTTGSRRDSNNNTDDITVDMNESYSDEPYYNDDEDDDDDNSNDLGGWLHDDCHVPFPITASFLEPICTQQHHDCHDVTGTVTSPPLQPFVTIELENTKSSVNYNNNDNDRDDNNSHPLFNVTVSNRQKTGNSLVIHDFHQSSKESSRNVQCNTTAVDYAKFSSHVNHHVTREETNSSTVPVHNHSITAVSITPSKVFTNCKEVTEETCPVVAADDSTTKATDDWLETTNTNSIDDYSNNNSKLVLRSNRVFVSVLVLQLVLLAMSHFVRNI